MQIAYFSPFNPQRSGISDFSEELVTSLKEYAHLTLFTSNENGCSERLNQEFEVYRIKDYQTRQVRDQFDIAVFHVGNNYDFHGEIVETFLRYGGILELHDIAMHHFLAEATLKKGKNDEYIAAMDYCHGIKGKQRAKDFLYGGKTAPWAKESLKYPVNKYLIDKAQAVIVHSDFAYEIVRGICLEVPLIKIGLHSPEIMQCDIARKTKAREKLDIKFDKLVMCVFGYASPEKRIVQILEAVSLYAKKYGDFHLYIVGKIAGIDIGHEIDRLELEDKVTVTGFVDLDDFNLYMLACDIAFNLRYPTQGESSASLAKLLGWGKTVFVTNIGTFREIPDHVVVKIEYGQHEVQQILENILKVRDCLDVYGTNAYKYALQYNNIKDNAKKYFQFFQRIIERHTIKAGFQDTVLDEIFRFGLNERNYVDHICKKMDY